MPRTYISRRLIKRAMEGKFETFGELAEAAGISTTTMSTATDSYNWTSKTLDSIATALGVPSRSLLLEDPTEVEHAPIKQRGRNADAPVLAT